MSARFWIEQWAAWAPGLDTQAQWLQWFEAPVAAAFDGVAPLAEMPAMMRRRLDPLGRAALQTAYALQPSPEACPMVFASRWGEVARSVLMLEQLALQQSLSPTAFSLSVHNAIGALYSIARQDRSNCVAVSAGEHSAEAGFAEAQGLLADGAAGVLLVYFDAPLPACLAQFAPSAAPGLQFLHAWACLIRPADGCRPDLLSLRAGAELPLATGLPADLQTLAFLTGQAPALSHGRWRWSRDGG